MHIKKLIFLLTVTFATMIFLCSNQLNVCLQACYKFKDVALNIIPLIYKTEVEYVVYQRSL